MTHDKKAKFIECGCGLRIKGFSEHHAEQNLQIHKKVSHKHKERIALINKIRHKKR